jgi:hypothetical protein
MYMQTAWSIHLSSIPYGVVKADALCLAVSNLNSTENFLSLGLPFL